MNKTLITILAFALIGAIAAIIYRTAQNSDLPDDEWFEFEDLPA
jgi:hypothetical protein